MKVKQKGRRADPKHNSLNQDTVEAVAAAARATALSAQSGQQEHIVELKATRTKPSNTRTGRTSKQHETGSPQPVLPGEGARTASTPITSPKKAEPEQHAAESLSIDTSQSSMDGGRRDDRVQEDSYEDEMFAHTREFGNDSGSSVEGAILSETATVPGDHAPDRLLSEGLGGHQVDRVDGVAEVEDGNTNWASMTVVALKEELRSRGLKVSGKKAVLVERLLEWER